jgi:hypothetical protein
MPPNAPALRGADAPLQFFKTAYYKFGLRMVDSSPLMYLAMAKHMLRRSVCGSHLTRNIKCLIMASF